LAKEVHTVLFDIAFVVLAILAPILCVWCYRAGLRDGRHLKEGKPLEPIRPLIDIQRPAAPTEDKYDIILDNINNYDGTSRGQKEVNL
jgi:hypothetical protein